jgi:hypothetical protein
MQGVDDDVAAFIGEFQRDSPTHPLGTPRNDCHSIFK